LLSHIGIQKYPSNKPNLVLVDTNKPDRRPTRQSGQQGRQANKANRPTRQTGLQGRQAYQADRPTRQTGLPSRQANKAYRLTRQTG
jgi:hypothetical protein